MNYMKKRKKGKERTKIKGRTEKES